jgi:uncharacterized protein
MQRLPSQFIKTAQICGIEHLVENKGHFYVEKNKVLSYGYPKGVSMKSKETQKGVEAQVVVKEGKKIKEPLFFCFGMLGKKDEQLLVPDITVEDGAQVKIIAHCSFPNAQEMLHNMQAKFIIGKNAVLEYQEHHYHGTKSGANVFPVLKVEVAEEGKFISDFNLSKGTVGKTEISLEVFLQKDARAEIETKVMGKNAKDEVRIIDKVFLQGENAKGLVRMRAAAKNGGKVLMQGETYAEAAGSTGHVDCQEIVVGKGSVAKAVPIVEVSNENARVTHEASVGKINQKELETLLTRGLSEDQATDLIVEAMMR